MDARKFINSLLAYKAIYTGGSCTSTVLLFVINLATRNSESVTRYSAPILVFSGYLFGSLYMLKKHAEVSEENEKIISDIEITKSKVENLSNIQSHQSLKEKKSEIKSDEKENNTIQKGSVNDLLVKIQKINEFKSQILCQYNKCFGLFLFSCLLALSAMILSFFCKSDNCGKYDLFCGLRDLSGFFAGLVSTIVHIYLGHCLRAINNELMKIIFYLELYSEIYNLTNHVVKKEIYDLSATKKNHDKIKKGDVTYVLCCNAWFDRFLTANKAIYTGISSACAAIIFFANFFSNGGKKAQYITPVSVLLGYVALFLYILTKHADVIRLNHQENLRSNKDDESKAAYKKCSFFMILGVLAAVVSAVSAYFCSYSSFCSSYDANCYVRDSFGLAASLLLTAPHIYLGRKLRDIKIESEVESRKRVGSPPVEDKQEENKEENQSDINDDDAVKFHLRS